MKTPVFEGFIESGGEIGNGGDAIVCDSTSAYPKEVELTDYYDAFSTRSLL